ncbi:MAG: tripartite ATP-independent transporter DctM subunit [Planctomycetota bacterium]|jgi:C4-dicarboxylate transporter DctM subunit
MLTIGLTMATIGVVLLLLGFPMMVPLLAAALFAVLYFQPFQFVDPEVLIQQWITGIQPAALIAVPMFVFAADIMTRGQAAERLLDLVMSFVGHVRGGLPITAAASCTLFGSISGSTQATVVAVGGPMRPRLLQAGYPDSFAMALIVNSSDIALLIPPSIGMIVYGVVSGASIGELFLAGIGPGLLILGLFCVYCRIASKRLGIEPAPRSTPAQRKRALVRALLPLGFPLIIVGGIYSGKFSPTEAAAISVLYAGVLEFAIFRQLSLRVLPDIARQTALVTAVVFVLIGAGQAFSWVVSYAELPQMLVEGVFGLSATSSQLHVLFSIAIATFVGCMFVDPIVVILILTPIFAPAAAAAGVDPILVGTVVTMQVAIGSATPPFGCDLFTAVAVFRRPYLEILRGTPPFLVILLASSALVIFVPQIALFLRDLAFR